MLKNRKVYVLRNKRLKTKIIQLHHNMLVKKHKKQ